MNAMAPCRGGRSHLRVTEARTLATLLERKVRRRELPPPLRGRAGERGHPPTSQQRQDAPFGGGGEPLSLSLPRKGGGNATLAPARLFPTVLRARREL